jgi:hypothetical protein
LTCFGEQKIVAMLQVPVVAVAGRYYYVHPIPKGLFDLVTSRDGQPIQ